MHPDDAKRVNGAHRVRDIGTRRPHPGTRVRRAAPPWDGRHV